MGRQVPQQALRRNPWPARREPRCRNWLLQHHGGRWRLGRRSHRVQPQQPSVLPFHADGVEGDDWTWVRGPDLRWHLRGLWPCAILRLRVLSPRQRRGRIWHKRPGMILIVCCHWSLSKISSFSSATTLLSVRAHHCRWTTLVSTTMMIPFLCFAPALNYGTLLSMNPAILSAVRRT